MSDLQDKGNRSCDSTTTRCQGSFPREHLGEKLQSDDRCSIPRRSALRWVCECCQQASKDTDASDSGSQSSILS